MLGMVVYAIFGTSRQLAVTSTSSSAAMLAALVAPLALTDAGRYLVLMSAATIAAGVIFLLGGLLRLGAVAPQSPRGDNPDVPRPPDLGITSTLTALGLRLKRETSPNRFYPTSGPC